MSSGGLVIAAKGGVQGLRYIQWAQEVVGSMGALLVRSPEMSRHRI